MTGDLTIEEAFRVLGIDQDSEPAEIRSVYRKLSKRGHPDKEGGSVEQQSLLNQAYEIAFEYASSSKAIRESTVAIRAFNSMVLACPVSEWC